jgi:membrane protease YdiL (CAAX protease family)
VHWLKRIPIIAFSVLAYAWTWACFFGAHRALTAMAEDRAGEAGLGLLVVLLAPFGPTLSALLMTSLLEGRAGLRDLWRRLRLWRVGARWYAFVLCWLVLAKLAGSWVVSFGGGGTYEMPNLSNWSAVPQRFVLILLLGGPLGEEIGWRGFALPRLIQGHGPMGASLRLGLIWALWHLPVFLIAGTDQYGQPLFWYAVMVTAYTFLFTWVHLHTGGSLLLALLHHTSINVGLWLTAMPALRSHEWSLFGLTMPGPWLATCAAAWLLVALVWMTGGFATTLEPAPTTA